MTKRRKKVKPKKPRSEQDHFLMRIKRGKRLYKFYYFRPVAGRRYHFEYRILSKEKVNGMNEENECIPDAAVMLKLAKWRMPYGKYKDRRLIDLPEPYVVWFAQKGFPAGQLGDMLRMVYEIKLNGLEYLFKPLRNL